MPSMRYHDVMLMALLERWDANTSIFHLLFEEMIVELEDIHHILRLPNEGETIHIEKKHTQENMMEY
jgi:hypothetical protein